MIDELGSHLERILSDFIGSDSLESSIVMSLISNDPWCDKAMGQIVEGTDKSCARFFNVYGYDSDSMLLPTSCPHMRDRVLTLTFSRNL
jgi:hypothetical protein